MSPVLFFFFFPATELFTKMLQARGIIEKKRERLEKCSHTNYNEGFGVCDRGRDDESYMSADMLIFSHVTQPFFKIKLNL